MNLIFTGQELYKAVLTFPATPALTYVAQTNNGALNPATANGVISSVSLSEVSAILSGNPIGVLSPNSLTISIYDFSEDLVPSNPNSPYYPYMTNGVEVQLSVSLDGGNTYNPLGTYYTQSWSTAVQNGYQAAVLTCTDLLTIIGGQTVPVIPSSTSDDLVSILTAVLANTTVNGQPVSYSISSGVTTRPVVFGLTPGALMRDTLNSLCQGLLARINVSRSGVVEVLPALVTVVASAPTGAEVVSQGTLTNTPFTSLTLSQNPSTIYNQVSVQYTQVDLNQPPVEVLQRNGLTLNPGANTYITAISQALLSITDVYFDLQDTATESTGQISNITYSATQSSISVTVTSTLAASTTGNLVVEGQLTGLSTSVASAPVPNVSPSGASVLTVQNPLIQGDSVAEAYAKDVASYLSSLNQQAVVSGYLTPLLTINDAITLSTGNANLDGNYLILTFSLRVADGSYSVDMNLAKL